MQADPLEGIRICQGPGMLWHRTICVMQAVAYVAGEEITDHPQCADPWLASMMIDINDSITHDIARQRLTEFVPRIVGTNGMSHQERTERARVALASKGYFQASSSGRGPWGYQGHPARKLETVTTALAKLGSYDPLFHLLDMFLPEAQPEPEPIEVERELVLA